MNTEQLFNQLGISPIRATKILESLDISIYDLEDPKVFSRLEDVINILKKYDEDSQNFFIKKATVGKQDKLKIMHEYVKLLEKKKFYEDISIAIEHEKEKINESSDLFKRQELSEKESSNKARLTLLAEEIELYHK